MKEFDQTRAFEEGWCISECIGSTYFPDGWSDIQRYNDSENFDSDVEALSYVARRAAEGSAYHNDAIVAWETRNFQLVKGARNEQV